MYVNTCCMHPKFGLVSASRELNGIRDLRLNAIYLPCIILGRAARAINTARSGVSLFQQ